jgi:hypothetical protein
MTARSRYHRPDNLRFAIQVFDAAGRRVEVLGLLADLNPALAAFDAAIAKYPDKRIYLCAAGRVIRRSANPTSSVFPVDADSTRARRD